MVDTELIYGWGFSKQGLENLETWRSLSFLYMSFQANIKLCE
jgi:hypothetical protein